MHSTKKLQINSIVSLVSKIVLMISGLILPRLILSNYGSEVNGLVSSINQFLSIITFLDLGVGSVVQAALYKPLVKKNRDQLGAVLNAANDYFKKIAYILVIYVLVLIFVYPQITEQQSLDTFSTAMLIIAISISTFGRYFFGIVNELLLNADQRVYVQLLTEILVVVLNLIAVVLLINAGYSIVTVKFVSSFIYLLRPILLTYYVRKNYDINYAVIVTKDPLPQKWSGVGQHIAYSIQNSTDVVVLTIFSTLENVSVYSVYKLVINAINLIVSSFTVGLQSFFGNLLAQDKIKETNEYFNITEWIIHNLVIFLYTLTAILIIPFVQLYTRGVNDVNYYVPLFAFIFVVANSLYSIRIPYQAIVFSAGHFKQTQKGSYFEAGLNIIVSLLLVNKLGLLGVAAGSLVAMGYRVFYLVNYLSKNILNRSPINFLKLMLLDILNFIIIFILGAFFLTKYQISNYFHWAIAGIILALTSLLVLLITNSIFNKSNVGKILAIIRQKN